LKYDSFDNVYFPKKGMLFSGDIQTYLYSSNFSGDFVRFSIAKAELSFATKISKKITCSIHADAGFKIGTRSVQFFDFVLGGYGFNKINNFKHFYGYNFLSIAGDSFVKSTFTLDYEIFKKNHINISANYANLGDNLFDTTDWISWPRYSGYAIGYGLESVIGPIELKYTWSPELGTGFAFINVGFWF
jgi:NTE family protein